MNPFRPLMLIFGLGLLAACAKETPPRPLSDFVENPILLEATMVRCGQNRSQTKYEADCVNAREAANRLALIEDEARRKELDAQSERKRQALRRTQMAAAEARRRAAEARRLREEAAYLGQFDAALVDPATLADGETNSVISGNEPGAVILPRDSVPERGQENAPVGAQSAAEVGTDLDAVREELKRRQDSSH